MQKEAVVNTDGPVLILAGAGSGKTKTLTARIAYLIQQNNVQPQHILAVTFTNKAAGEMATRVSEMLAGRRKRSDEKKEKSYFLPWLGTFHSICVKILRHELNNAKLPYTQYFTIYDSSDQLSLIRMIMKDFKIDQKQYNPRAVKAYIEGAKNELMTPAAYAKFADSYFQEVTSKIYTEYQKRMVQANAMDFDDLINNTLILFEQHPKILQKYQVQFKYILVDEYQDTNKGQYTLVKILAKKHQNIFVVGDDWQAIYAFRGADFRNILRFEKDYPRAKIIKLEQNYRSTQNILDAAHNIITKNAQRSDKKLFTNRAAGYPIKVVECLNDWSEGEYVISEVRDLIRNSTSSPNSLDQVVVLYRTNAQSRVLEESLIKADVPYKVVGAVRFYDRKEIKDILAYLRLLHNPEDRVSFERAVNRPSRKIGPKTIKDFYAAKLKGEAGPSKVQDFLNFMNKMRRELKGKNAAEIVSEIVNKSGYKDWVKDGTVEGEGRWENIMELKSAAAVHQNLDEFLERVALVQDTDSENERRRDENSENFGSRHDMFGERPALRLPGVLTLMTTHAAKGLEFDTVIITGLEEGLFPHQNSLHDPAEMEEERRLAYVGMTRPKRRLYLVYATERRMFGSVVANAPSRFISEIPENLVELVEW